MGMAVQCLLLLLVLLLAGVCTATQYYYVSAGDGDSGCPDGVQCHNLSYYVNDTAAYFTSDTVFYFLEGTHELDQDVQVTGAVNLTLQGLNSSGATIWCTNKNRMLNFAAGENIDLLSLTKERYLKCLAILAGACNYRIVGMTWISTTYSTDLLGEI